MHRALSGLAPGIALAIALAGCTVGPDFKPPSVRAPSAWGPEPQGVASTTVSAEIDTQWWRSFHDPELTSLAQRLAKQNLDLKTAAEHVLQSVAETRVAAAQGLPHIEGQSIYNYDRASINGTNSLLVLAPGASVNFSLYQEGLQSSWELDLFGKVRRAVEAREAETLASVEDRRAIAVAALAELAQDYLQLRGTQAILALTQHNLAIADNDITLVQSRFGNGYANTLDLAQAKGQRDTIASQLPPLEERQSQLINALGLLLAETPRALEQELSAPAALPAVPPSVPVSLPGTLVRQRPDVREAEAKLHAATAQTGVAVAQFYPDVTLMGGVNVQSLHTGNLFTLGSYQFNVGPTVTIPIFEGGQLRGNLQLAQSQQREAAIAFQRAVLTAWQEVDDALTAYTQAQRQETETARAVSENQIALAAAQQRYAQGLVDMLNVNQALAQLLESQTSLVNSNVEIATDLVNLYRALGGGWAIAEPAAKDTD